jgi:hypothetical protein
MRQPGYYPGFETLSQKDFWDDATRKVVLKRVDEIPPIRFFSESDSHLMQAVLDRVLPQDDRDEDRKIPILNYIDERLYSKRTDGYQYEDMPEDPEAYLLGLQAIQSMAETVFGKSFTDLQVLQQEEILQSIHDEKPLAAHTIWKKLSVKHYWEMLVQDAIAAYYSHPYAWDEIGFGGPAYPRGYMRIEKGLAEPWEVKESRYEWSPPGETLSDRYNSKK